MPIIERNQLTGFGFQSAQTVLSLDAGTSLEEAAEVLNSATVYASLEPAVNAAQALEYVRIDLVAEVLGQRHVVASAYVRPPHNTVATSQLRMVANVTGLNVDMWHVQVRASDPTLVLTTALAAKYCCASYSVNVPQPLLVQPSSPNDQAQIAIQGLWGPMPNPHDPALGDYLAFSTTDANGAELDFWRERPGQRVLHIFAHSAGGADATITINKGTGDSVTYTIDANETIDLYPRGTLPINSLQWTNLMSLIVETVR